MSSSKEQNQVISTLRMKKDDLEFALKRMEFVQASVLQGIVASLPPDESQVQVDAKDVKGLKKLLDNVAMYTKIDRVICDMKKNDDVDLELLARPNGLKKGEGYLIAWSKAMKDRINDACTLTAGVCGIGAGFTYTTIFSASRGSIGYMTWALMAFLFGFLLLTFVQVGLSWLANMPRTTNYPRFFDNLVGWLLFFGMAAGMFLTATGTILSILCLYGIQYGPDVSGATTDASRTHAVRAGFWAAIGVMCAAALYLIILHGFFFLWNCTKWRRLSAIYWGGFYEDDEPTKDASA